MRKLHLIVTTNSYLERVPEIKAVKQISTDNPPPLPRTGTSRSTQAIVQTQNPEGWEDRAKGSLELQESRKYLDKITFTEL